MTKRSLLMAAVLVLVAAVAALAGLDYPMKCSTCGYASRVQIGGGMQFDQLTGFCGNCGKFVYVKWNRGATKPQPVSRVQDPRTGKVIEYYKCPHCAKPFVPYPVGAADTNGPGFDRCPKCGKRTFRVEKDKGIIAFD